MEKKKISLVIPAYNEEKTLGVFFTQLSAAVNSLPKYDREVIFVNDGSSDTTWEIIESLAIAFDWVKGINFSKNFGKEIALSAGIDHAKGDAVITLDADGQHDVSKFGLFLEQWEQGYEVVYNKRSANAGANITKRLSSKIFYWIFNSISDFRLEPQTTDYRLLDRKVVNIFGRFTEKNRLYRGLIDWIGFNTKELEFDALAPIDGRVPSYSYWKLFNLAIHSIISFSVKPLKIVAYIWVFLCICSFIGLVWIVIDRLTGGVMFTNLGLFMLLNTLLIGIVMISLGMIAVYIANIHEEVRQRPLYIIKDKID